MSLVACLINRMKSIREVGMSFLGGLELNFPCFIEEICVISVKQNVVTKFDTSAHMQTLTLLLSDWFILPAYW